MNSEFKKLGHKYPGLMPVLGEMSQHLLRGVRLIISKSKS